MTIADLHANEELRQYEFPVTREKIFLAHAGVCPIPRRVAEAIRSYALECTRGDQETLLPVFQIRQTRELAAKLLNASFDEISFVGPTSLALSLIAGGLSVRKRDNILVYFDDYPSNVYPWMALAEKGVQVRFINIRSYGVIRAIDVKGQVDEQTRLVALASNHFVAGFRPDLEEIGRFLQEKGILFCVDGIQTVGAFPTDARWFDFLAADSHKWMLGPSAAGLLYVRKSARAQMRPTVFGWHNVESPSFVAQESMVHPADGRRYEAGSENLLGLVGLRACMELLLEVGVDNIAAELLRKRAWVVPELRRRGWDVLQGDMPVERASSIISFSKPGVNLAELHGKLEAAGMILSLRSNRKGESFLRISPHFYNTDAELHRVLDAL